MTDLHDLERRVAQLESRIQINDPCDPLWYCV